MAPAIGMPSSEKRHDRIAAPDQVKKPLADFTRPLRYIANAELYDDGGQTKRKRRRGGGNAAFDAAFLGSVIDGGANRFPAEGP
jgi:hypothetical protein